MGVTAPTLLKTLSVNESNHEASGVGSISIRLVILNADFIHDMILIVILRFEIHASIH